MKTECERANICLCIPYREGCYSLGRRYVESIVSNSPLPSQRILKDPPWYLWLFGSEFDLDDNRIIGMTIHNLDGLGPTESAASQRRVILKLVEMLLRPEHESTTGTGELVCSHVISCEMPTCYFLWNAHLFRSVFRDWSYGFDVAVHIASLKLLLLSFPWRVSVSLQ